MKKNLCFAFLLSFLVLIFVPGSILASNDEINWDEPFFEVKEFEVFYDEEYENSDDLLDPNTIESDFSIMGGGNCSRTYPGTNTCVLPGDVLYTSKSPSTGFVGHVGIVNTSSNVAHVLTAAGGGFRTNDTVNEWRNRFQAGQTRVYRYNNASRAYNAATKISGIRNNFVQYGIGTNRYDQRYNYCSKMIWQAYSLGGVTLRGWTNTGQVEFISPWNLVNQSYFTRVATF
ncbi:YiiX/YebB-like N1pC/P60 family cysteine hydrolase (plasmid) [Alkalihalophilus sp. As8PL]|uniref:YiiX/YebB-like N1pC/P60 family cysteine hydrolase n=1 Tax=Alkalihalophilus sp. As8PL TaxID=3237103 RepID=A0AB39BMZ3_9BACI